MLYPLSYRTEVWDGFEPPTFAYSPVSSPKSAPRIYMLASLSEAPVPEDRRSHPWLLRQWGFS